MKRILLIIMVLVGAESNAQFSNVWPSWKYPREGSVFSEQSFSGVVERVEGAARSGGPVDPSGPSLWRSNRAELKGYKAKLVELMAYYVDPSLADTNGYYAPLYSTNGTAFPLLTRESIAVLCELPTNYFDYTPWRCLGGLGPFQDDTQALAAVGHPYGWVNNTTTNGGTNFPAGQTNWYTTDYGWEPMTNILAQYKWTLHNKSANYSWEPLYDTNFFYFGEGIDADLPTARAEMEAAYEKATSIVLLWSVSPNNLINQSYEGLPAGWLTRAWGSRFRGVATNVSTVYEHEVDFYLFSRPPIFSTNRIWNANGHTVFEGEARQFQTIGPSYSGTVYSLRHEFSNFPAIPSSTNDGTAEGFQGATTHEWQNGTVEAAIIKWTETANGFKYK
jgi:hypothetical protein